jgi:hypothetical protein
VKLHRQCSVRPGTVKSRLNYARKQIKQAVLDTEKREGVKLYSLSALPLFTLLLRDEMANIVVPEMVSSSVVKGIAEALGINIAGDSRDRNSRDSSERYKRFKRNDT